MIYSILASTGQGAIGNRGTLPWSKHKEDLTWFKNHTTGHVVVMGRNTWDDPKMPKPLPDRINCVFSSRPIIENARRLHGDPTTAILQVQQQFPKKDVFIIGGKQLYESTVDLVERVYLTRIKGNYWVDTRINLDKYLSNFRLKSVKPGQDCTYEIWDRVTF